LLGLALLVVGAAVTGSAFAYAQGTNVAWLERTDIGITFTDFEVVTDDEPTLRMTVEIHNPTGRSVLPRPPESLLVVYRGSEYVDGRELTVPRTTEFPERRIGPGETATLTFTARIEAGKVDEARRAVAAGRANPSGIVALRMNHKVYEAEVG
jgi:hypothetical protein